MNRDYTRKPMANVIPKGAKWVKDKVVSFDPKSSQVATASSGKLDYDYLVVASGLQLNWENTKGLKESLGTNGICSIYSYDTVDYVQQSINDFKGGVTIFTQPAPIKCAGAPQKVMYLADDIWGKKNITRNINFISALGSIFGVPYYAPALTEVCRSRGLNTIFNNELVEVKGPQKIAVFKDLKSGEISERDSTFYT